MSAAPCRAIWWGSKADSVWVSTPVALDGDDKKWRPRDGDEDSGIAYAFTNDGQDLYIMLSPHTRSAKDQLAGTYIQDFTIWVDTRAGKARTLGLRLPAPQSRYDPEPREAFLVGPGTAAAEIPAGGDSPEIRLGPVTAERGILEARIPLRLLGTALPENITVGLETSPAKAEPPHPRKAEGADTGGGTGAGGVEGFGGRGGGRHGGARGGGGRRRSGVSQEEDLTPLQFWIRVTLAKPPKHAAK